jgi:transposase InsO family protein
MDVKYLPQMQNEARRRYLFVAIDRATRWVFVAIKDNKTAASAKAFLRALQKACPIKIQKLLTDNGKEFTDRLFANRERAPSGNHEFDQLCQQFGIEHRLTRPGRPRPMGWWSALTDALPMYSRPTGSAAAKTWSRLCCAMWPCTTTSCRSQP